MKKTMLVVYIVVLLIVLLAERIGRITIPLGTVGAIILLPLLYAVIMGLLVVSVGRRLIPLVKKHIGEKEIAFAGKVFGIAMLPLALRLGVMVGSQIEMLLKVGPALLLQQVGSLGTLLFGLPVALALGLKREAVGATVSICREPTLGVMTEKYGLGKPEMIGSLGVYMIGTVFGTIIFSIIGSLSLLTGLHPFALAMGAGIGSASMMTAAMSTISQQAPLAMQEQILSFGVTSNLLGNLTEAYVVSFITLPLANWFYKKFNKEAKSE